MVISSETHTACVSRRVIAVAMFVVAVLFFAMPRAGAEPARKPVLTLSAPVTAVVPGKMISVDLVALNPANYEQTFTAPKSLVGELSIGGGAPVPVQLKLASVDTNNNEIDTISVRSFLAYSYTFEVPASFPKGDAVLTVHQPEILRTAFAIDPAPPAVGTPPSSNTADTGASVDTSLSAQLAPLPAVDKVKRGYLQNFATYEPVYFIMGFDKPAAKFQFSFQYQILANEGYVARTLPFLTGLRFAYTQRSLWDITSESSPFYDTSYMPEFYFASTPASRTKWGWFTWLGLQGGYAHESNGKNGADSRSMNKLFARGSFAIGNLDGWRAIITPRVWGYIGDMSDNPDLNDYRGYGDLQIAFGKNNGLGLSVYLRPGQDFNKWATQVDLTYPIDFLANNFAAYFLAQYWNGYGESLLQYNKRTETIRFGISLVR